MGQNYTKGPQDLDLSPWFHEPGVHFGVNSPIFAPRPCGFLEPSGGKNLAAMPGTWPVAQDGREERGGQSHGFTWLLLGNMFLIFAYCGLVGNHLAAKV